MTDCQHQWVKISSDSQSKFGQVTEMCEKCFEIRKGEGTSEGD